MYRTFNMGWFILVVSDSADLSLVKMGQLGKSRIIGRVRREREGQGVMKRLMEAEGCAWDFSIRSKQFYAIMKPLSAGSKRTMALVIIDNREAAVLQRLLHNVLVPLTRINSRINVI